ncbi:MAG: hypothetical protein ACLP4V_10100, partial [Methylocella sp.]
PFRESERSRLFPSAPTKSATSCNFPGQFRPELYSTPNFETVSSDVQPGSRRVRQLDGLPTISLAEPVRRAAGEKAGVTFITEHGGDVRLRKDDK